MEKPDEQIILVKTFSIKYVNDGIKFEIKTRDLYKKNPGGVVVQCGFITFKLTP